VRAKRPEIRLGLPVIVAAVALSAAAAEPSHHEQQIRLLLDRSGFTARIRETPQRAATQVISALGGHTGDGTQQFVQRFAAAFDAEPIVQRVTDALVLEYDAESVEALSTGYGYAPGSDVADGMARVDSPDGRAQLDAFSRRILGDPPSPRRRALIQQIDEAMGLSATRLATAVAMTVSVTQALDRVLDVQRSGAQAEPGWMAGAIRRRLEVPIQVEAYSYLLFVTRTLTHAALSDFLQFAQTDAARAFARSANAAYEHAVGAALESFEAQFSAWLAERDAPALRAAARERGLELGGRWPADRCVVEAFRRDGLCEDLVCQAVNVEFLDACVTASRPTPALCAAAGCAQRGRRDRFCRQLTASVRARCGGSKAEKPQSSAAGSLERRPGAQLPSGFRESDTSPPSSG
jgi:hypothetical protein